MAPTLRTRKPKAIRNEPYKQQQKRQQTGHISSQWQRQEAGPPASRGLQNPGNLCYMLSTLQAFLHVPKVVNWLEDHCGRCAADCLICTFGFFGRLYWDTISDEIAINGWLEFLRSALQDTEAFRTWNWAIQHDAEEFCTLFFRAMVESNPAEAPIIHSLFQHELLTTITCPNPECRAKSPRSDPNNILSVRFDNAAPLERILRNTTFAGNDIPGRYCEECETKADTYQTELLETVPEVLVFQLIRFDYSGGKKMEEIKYSDYLNITTYTVDNTPTVYRLSSVVHHRGTMNSGHYIAVAMGPNGAWEQMDDQTVTRVRIGEALRKPRKPEEGWTPYLLFYTRQRCHAGAETRR